ncbi:MAG: hypothetical protein C7B46_10890 [Sulfobacillus benefaciens]|uniref:Uncharacterized protein n=1 Tax=Sulfobacillus benefaciens TaxID=453960 RepID=A0A2T2XF97_9FIRM|nr:MAG: hypothetical protein C7B46_10890 [Sulfobacillus benefaciens]
MVMDSMGTKHLHPLVLAISVFNHVSQHTASALQRECRPINLSLIRPLPIEQGLAVFVIFTIQMN